MMMTSERLEWDDDDDDDVDDNADDDDSDDDGDDDDVDDVPDLDATIFKINSELSSLHDRLESMEQERLEEINAHRMSTTMPSPTPLANILFLKEKIVVGESLEEKKLEKGKP